LRVISQAPTEPVGHWTQLSRSDIEGAHGAIPRVSHGDDLTAAPSGTIVRGVLKEPIDAGAMSAFVQDFVQYDEEHVFFNGELISRRPFQLPSESERDISPITPPDTRWMHGNVELSGCLFETPGHLLQAEVTELTVAGVGVRVRGWLRFENGPIAVLKRGFKIC